MRIAYLSDVYAPAVNGVVVAQELLAQEMLSRGHRVAFYVPAYSIDGSVKKERGILVERFASLPVPTYKDFQIVMLDYPRLSRSLSGFNPDVVHVHSPAVIGLAGVMWAKRHNKPIVGTYHAVVAETLVYVSPYRLFPGVSLLEKGRSGGGESWVKKAAWKMMNPFFGQCDRIVVPAVSIKRELARHGFKKDVRVISNGMRVENFAPKERYLGGAKILHVGRLGYEKNVDLVIRAMTKVVRKYPEATLTIVGDGPARTELVDLAFKHRISEKIIFTGWKSREELPAIYRSADVFVTASAMETQGLVILEAMLSGLPVVGVNKYAIPDLVKDGKSGWVVKEGSVEGIARALVKVLSNPVGAEEMGRVGRAMAVKHNISITGGEMEGLYKEVA